ncbi:hypothetical protein GCM10009550_53430 [Actinocorallia libanotica]|uniref:Uncharacterized protein n=1 Tax=Actinocorallia libanotica TaxID=46162 RepID=A0ABN1RPR1_9ACTN
MSNFSWTSPGHGSLDDIPGPVSAWDPRRPRQRPQVLGRPPSPVGPQLTLRSSLGAIFFFRARRFPRQGRVRSKRTRSFAAYETAAKDRVTEGGAMDDRPGRVFSGRGRGG